MWVVRMCTSPCGHDMMADRGTQLLLRLHDIAITGLATWLSRAVGTTLTPPLPHGLVPICGAHEA